MSDASNRVTFFVAGDPAPAGSKSAFSRVADPHPPALLVAKVAAARDLGVVREALRVWATGLRTFVQVRDSSKYTKPWQTRVAQVARSKMPAVLFPKGAAVKLSLSFVVVRPKAQHVAGDRSRPLKAGFEYALPLSTPDALKMARAVEDALTGIAYDDDAQIVEELIWKTYGEAPGVRVVVEPATGQFLRVIGDEVAS
jgi:crossover junction endodeoxyribonuclease RusA